MLPVRARRISLQGVVNFRDLGGYATVDGRLTRWGQIFRSDVLADLTDADLDVLSGIVENRVREIYRRFVTDQCGTFAKLLELIDTEPLPMLIHCTSGRDRTGFASAVLLMAMGVSRPPIAEDYALSNQYRRDLTFQIGGSVQPEVMATLTNAHPDYLAASFQAIDEGWGSDAAYLRAALGLSAERQNRLQEKLLEMPESSQSPPSGPHQHTTG